MDWSEDSIETRFIQPYEAVKIYVCRVVAEILEEGVGHIVAVPRLAPDLRRHWHKGCWNNRANRPPVR